MKILLIIILMMTSMVDAFTNLSSLQQYAAQHQEYPDADTNNWSDPTFLHFRKSLEPTFLDSLKRKFGFGNPLLWTPQEFIKGLETAVTKVDMDKAGKAFAGLAIDQDTRFIIWSDLHGAFHSLVRSLLDLREQAIIDDNLHIVPTDTYMVFNGNALEGSAYVLETATVIFLLQERNPGKLFYLMGDDEDMNRWKDRGLGRQLRECCGARKGIERNVNDYFKNLIYALYITDAEKKYTVRISSPIDFLDESFENAMTNFLGSLVPGKLTNYYFSEEQQIKATTEKHLHVIIEGRSFWDSEAVKPIIHNKRADDVMIWQLFSGQNRYYRQLYRFFYDAYAIVNFKKVLKQSTLVIRSRDVRKQEPFHDTCYNLFTAVACN